MKAIHVWLIASVSMALLLYALDGPKSAPQPFTKIERLAWESLRDKEEALSKERREFALELCASHKVPADSCRIDTEKMEVSQAEPEKKDAPKDSSKKDALGSKAK